MAFYTPGRTTSYPTDRVDTGLRLHFLGGAQEVGNVGCVIEDKTGTRVLVDYGLSPGDPPSYPDECPSVDAAIITHSHLDHIGMVPWISANHGCPIYSTDLTGAIAPMMWHDTYKISKIEGHPLPWDKRDIEETAEVWKSVQFNEKQTIDEWSWQLHPAGHVPGAAMIEFELPECRILWTGDIDVRDSPNVQGAKPVSADVLVMEGTYGGREHPDRKEEEERFIKKIQDVVARGGIAIVPAFASGRGQGILRLLYRADPRLRVHYDGMGKRVTKHWMDHPHHITDADEWTRIWRWVRRVGSKSDRKKALHGDVIVTTSGMLKGGPVLWYLNRLKDDQESAVLITGYQAEGTGGEMLLENGSLPIYGTLTEIACEVERYYLSNHCGHNHLVEFAKKTGAKHVVLFHLPEEAIEPLRKSIEENGQIVHIPENSKSLHIPI